MMIFPNAKLIKNDDKSLILYMALGVFVMGKSLEIITDRVLLGTTIKFLYPYGDSLNKFYYLCTLKGIE